MQNKRNPKNGKHPLIGKQTIQLKLCHSKKKKNTIILY